MTLVDGRGIFVVVYCRYLERIIRLHELEDFAVHLMSHQMATTADGVCVHACLYVCVCV